MAARIDREELRSLVRQALKDALGASAATAVAPSEPAARAGGFAGQMRAALANGRPAKLAVALRTAAELDRFARDILEAGEQDDLKKAIIAGEIRFEIARGATDERPAAGKPAGGAGAFQMKSGVLSETRVVEIARNHSRILLGGDVVLTPLARDKARELKVELVRQKP